jgi:hypothetical protein
LRKIKKLNSLTSYFSPFYGRSSARRRGKKVWRIFRLILVENSHRMFGGMDDFESGIDINSILNDTSLHDELASLGWVDHGPPAVRQPVKQAKGTTVPKPESQPALVPIMPDTIEHLDIGSIGLVDENMEFTEADAQDEGLLAEFALISGEHAPQQGHSEPEEDEPPATDASLHAPPAPQSTVPVQAPVQTRPPPPAAAPIPPASQTTAPPSANGIPTVEEAKRNALKFKREGNNTEALKWLRLSKQIENGTFQGAADLPTSPAVTSSGAAPSKAPKPVPSAGKKPSVPVSAAPAAPATNPFSTLGDEPSSSTGNAVIGNDIFGPLESAIQEASKAALRDAKYAEREKDTKQALVKMREYKALQQELTVLVSRRNTPGAAPALFHWEVKSTARCVSGTCTLSAPSYIFVSIPSSRFFPGSILCAISALCMHAWNVVVSIY